jgi:hypothetical protein
MTPKIGKFWKGKIVKNKHTRIYSILADLIEHSEYGPIAQFFVFSALLNYAETVAATKLEEFDKNSLIPPEQWQGVAREIAGKLNVYMQGEKNETRNDGT